MRREKLEKYLKQKVRIELFGGEILKGYLRKTGEEDFKGRPNLYFNKNYYFLTDGGLYSITCLFRLSHIVNIEVINNYAL